MTFVTRKLLEKGKRKKAKVKLTFLAKMTEKARGRETKKSFHFLQKRKILVLRRKVSF